MGSYTAIKPLCIKCAGSTTSVELGNYHITYKFKPWALLINPRLLLPALRHEHRKIIYRDGKRWGEGNLCGGCLPIYWKGSEEVPWQSSLNYWIRKHLGLKCSYEHRGYYQIRVGKEHFNITTAKTYDGNLQCMMYTNEDNSLLGNFIFDPSFSKVYIYKTPISNQIIYTLVGYIADAMLLSNVAQSLYKEIVIMG